MQEMESSITVINHVLSHYVLHLKSTFPEFSSGISFHFFLRARLLAFNVLSSEGDSTIDKSYFLD